MSTIKIFQADEWLKALQSNPQNTQRSNYKAMFSSWWNGIVIDPTRMFVPIDDHQVHRGDAVFEALKVINSKIYLLKEHLDRLERSAAAIGLICPYTRTELEQIMQQTLQASNLQNAILRLFLSRGPGSFSTSPYDTLGAQLYLVVTTLQPVPELKHKMGVRIGLSQISPKEGWLAQIKSCNYLQNVLMKKEAIDRGLDFTIGVNSQGFITEGSTENLIVLTADGALIKPSLAHILRGTTMQRTFELAANVKTIKIRQEANLTVKDLAEAQEIMMVGTTLDVLAVTEFEGQKVSDGQPGPVAMQLRELILKDQL